MEKAATCCCGPARRVLAQARFIFLIRHPLHILESALAGKPEQDPVQTTNLVVTYLREFELARPELGGLTVRYEDLTNKAGEVVSQVCEHLGMR